MHISIKYQEFRLLLSSDKSRMLFFLLINVKIPIVVGILTFMNRKTFIISWVEHEKRFITSGPDKAKQNDSVSLFKRVIKGQILRFEFY